MNKPKEYQYSTGVSVDLPPNYQRSPFEGKKFITSYIASRKKIFADVETQDIDKVKQFFNDLKTRKIDLKETKSDTFKTLQYLCYQEFNKIGNKDTKLADKLVRKYEINKKLYLFYDEESKKHSKDILSLSGHILLSLLCLKLYERTLNLKYLNTSLKINDVLCSEIKKMGIADKSLTKFAIKQELGHITNLLNKKGIKIR